MAEYKLELKGICKSFPGVKALDNVQLSVRPGTVHALMGENGAGKSTLMKCLFGIYKMDAGEIYLDGEKIEVKDPDDAMSKGIAMVHQELQPVLARSVGFRHTIIRDRLQRSIFLSDDFLTVFRIFCILRCLI